MSAVETVECDVVVIGAGPAGLSAALYCARAGRDVVVLAGKAPSALERAHEVSNFLSHESVAGADLLAKMRRHAEAAGANLVREDAIAVMLAGQPKMVTTRTKLFQAKAVVVATGRGFKGAKIRDEEEYIGRGVSYCALCDGPLYRERPVVIFGGDEEAVEDALALDQMGCKVTLVIPKRRHELPGEVWSKLEGAKFEVLDDVTVTEVVPAKNGTVRAVKVKPASGNGEERELETHALFIITHVASTALLKSAGLELDGKGFVVVDAEQKTNFEGVYAAGDVTGGVMQVATAVGQGAVAGIEANKYLRSVR
ncbi:MAG: thioredoxin-disulfide reductase [Promethearchaeota archaeon]